MDENDIKANLKAAQEYLRLLKNLQIEIGYAERQITVTAKEAENQIATVFSDLVTRVTTTLTKRRDELISNTEEIRRKGLLPLQQCQAVIGDKIKNTVAFIDEGNNLLTSASKLSVGEFNSKSALLGSLPEVPPLKDVPYVSFRYDADERINLGNICSQFGSVLHISPVQITSLLERPGAVLVEWSISDDEEHFRDVQEYHLQWAFGTEKNLKSDFHTSYIGPNLQHLVKDLNLNQNYSFRVCCKYEGDAQWTPWSLPQVCRTTIAPFAWEENVDFQLANENRIASCLSEKSSLLRSRRIEFNVGYSVEFTFLECDENLEENYVGLIAGNEPEGSIVNSSAVCVEANGSIYGSGVKKVTKFTPVKAGGKVCFSCVYKDEDKLRINIDSNEDRVTYDWLVDGVDIYIAGQFNSPRWKIMIE